MHTHKQSASDGVELSYRIMGDGPLTVILIHGWMTSGAVYDDLIAALGTDGLRIIVPDLRGTGGSGRPDSGYTIEQYARDVMTIADAEGARSFAVVGHSMGGLIAQWLAATQIDRVRGSVLLCSVPPVVVPLPDEMRAMFRSSAGSPEKQAGIVDGVCKELSAEARARLLKDAATIPAACIEQGFDAWSTATFIDKLGATKAPTLVVGDDDPAIPVEFLKETIVASIPGAGFVYVPGPGHYIQLERPRETASLLRAFLTALRP